MTTRHFLGLQHAHVLTRLESIASRGRKGVIDGGHLRSLAIKVVEGGSVLWHCGVLREWGLAQGCLFYDWLRQDIIKLILSL